MEIKAKVIKQLGVQSGTSKAGKNWQKATLVVETLEQYPKTIAINNMQDAVNFNAISLGAVCVFSVDVQSREFQGKWYTSVDCWKWNQEMTQPTQTPAYPQPAVAPAPQPNFNGEIPF